jgi:tol-pal system protein YbgF
MSQMRKTLASVLICATLPFAAGFAVHAHAQDGGLQYTPPGGTAMAVSGAPSAAVGDMTRIAQLEQQIRDLTDQLEKRGFEVRQLQDAFNKYKADTDMRLQALEAHGATSAPMQPQGAMPEQTATPPSPAPMQNETAPQSQAAPSSGAAEGTLVDPNGAFQPKSTPALGQLTETGPADNGGAVTSGTPQGGAQPANAAQAYDKAFSYLQQSNYTDAQAAFLNFLTTYPTHPPAANAQYWLGETYFAQTQYSTAAKTFAKAFQDHPNGQKAPDALLKLAMTLDKMNKRDDACLTLAELAKRFPAGPASVLRRGTEEGHRMGCKS